MKYLISLCIFLIIAFPCEGRTITVDDDGPADFNNIQAAINDANDGDIVVVAVGTYTGTGNRDIDFLGKAITVRSTDPNDPDIVAATIINCDGTVADPHKGFFFDRGEDSNSVVSGFTITGGYDWRGGGIDCRHNSNPTIINCIINRNSANNGGGGLAIWYSSPRVIHCTFSENLATFGGGGIDCSDDSSPTIINCTISGNSAMYGGGIACVKGSPTISNCLISNNSAWLGGGIECVKSNVTIANCTISGNLAERGGGVYFTVPDIWTLSTSSIEDSKPTLTNCTITGNSASYSGGAISFWYHGTANITNCILWDNKAHYGYQISLEDDSSTFLNYTDLQGGQDALYIEPGSALDFGIGNIDDNPGFVGPGYWDVNGIWVEGDYHLLPASPCIDTGDPNYIPEPNATDLDGQPRLLDGDEDGIPIIDMGAYEYRPPIPADVNIEPDTLNLQSKGNWITCHIRLPEDYSTADIDPDSIFLEDIVSADSLQINNDVAIVKFSRSEVQDILSAGECELTISGELIDETIFEGSDTIRVINNGGGKPAK